MSVHPLRFALATGALAVLPIAVFSAPARPGPGPQLAPPMLLRPAARKPRSLNPGCPGASLGAGAFVGGASFNVAPGVDAAVLGGQDNQSCDKLSGIGAGYGNIIASSGNAVASFIGAGENNLVPGYFSFLGAGVDNYVPGPDAFVGAGYDNGAIGAGAFVGAGGILYNHGGASEPNQASGTDAFVGAGDANMAQTNGAFIGGGIDNVIQAANGAVTSATDSGIAAGDFNSIIGSTAGFVSSFIGAGSSNVVSAGDSAISGGYRNSVTFGQSFVGAGHGNVVENTYAFDGAGYDNVVSGSEAFAGAGYENVAAGKGSVTPGGSSNEAYGIDSFAAGTGSQALHSGTFAWSDDASGTTALKSTAPNQFLVRASGGIKLYSSPSLASGVRLAPGSGTWSSLSDRTVKDNIVPVEPQDILQRVAALPVSEWSYRTEDPHVRHVGPMAQDFYAAFGVGEDDRHITSIDEDGVALASIKALAAKNADLERRLADLSSEVRRLERRQ